MGLGQLLRSKTLTVADSETGESQVFTVQSGIAPDWANSGYRGGMGIPAAWRASLLIAHMLASAPWDAQRKRAGGPVEVLDPTPPLLEQPAPPDTRATTLLSWVLDYLWQGNGISLVAARDRFGWPTAVYPVPASMVGVRRVPAPGMSTLPVGAIEYSVGTMRDLGVNDVIHIKGPCEPGALRGMGVLEQHFASMRLSQEQMRQANQLSRSGVPTGVLQAKSPDVTRRQLVDAKRSWLVQQRDRTVAALGPSIEFTPLSWNPEQLQLIEARTFDLTTWELIFGLPAGWLGGQQTSRNYANVEQDAVNLLKFTLMGHFSQFEQTLSLAMPRGINVKANLNWLLRADTLTRYQAYALAIDKWLTRDEIRMDYEDLPAWPSGYEPATPDLAASTPASDGAEAMMGQGVKG